jgi:ADP-ribose pyrophosphatase
MEYREKTISKEEVYQGSIIRVERQTVELPDGRKASRDIIRNAGASAVVPITEDRCIIMVTQFRKPIETTSLEIPAGKLDEGEDPLHCAARELEEETGYKAEKIEKILTLHPAPAFADEMLHIYKATGLTPGTSRPDEDEFITAQKYRIEDVLKMIEDGTIKDAKTIAGVLYCARLLER